MTSRVFLFALSLAGCASPNQVSTTDGAPLSSAASSATTAPSAIASPKPAASLAPIASAAPPEAPKPAPRFSITETQALLFPGAEPPSGCDAGAEEARIRCLLEKRFEGHSAAQALVLSLYARTGSVVGVEAEHMMEGGFRGSIHIVPELPIGRYEKHLQWVVKSAEDFDDFFKGLASRAQKPVRYRIAPIGWKFFRSVNRTTPSAYASGWHVAYNVSGSLHGSFDAVRETLFHEIFHLNDAARLDGPVQWSRKALGSVHDAILQKCSTRPQCLAPYAPTATMVRGGTYYAFQPNNGDAVNEYAADLATRYYRETRALLRNEKPEKPAFKCGPSENATAWKAMVDEFFGGIDLIPPCD